MYFQADASSSLLCILRQLYPEYLTRGVATHRPSGALLGGFGPFQIFHSKYLPVQGASSRGSRESNRQSW